MPKFKAKYIFDKMYEFEGEKEIEAKDIKEAIEKLKKAGRRGHLIDETFEVDDKPFYSPRRMHVYNSEKFNSPKLCLPTDPFIMADLKVIS